MTKKTIIAGALAGIVALGAVGAFAYYRTERLETCETALKRFNENHLCINTNKGTMIFELYPDAAPKAVEQIKKLTNQDHFFDNLEFYRLVRDFVIQGGIQDFRIANEGMANIDSTMQKKIDLSQEKFATESNFEKLNFNSDELAQLETEQMVSTPNLNTRAFDFGSISFANGGPNTNSTEIFVVTSKDKESQNVRYLNGRFTNFGTIVEGKSVLESLNELGEKGDDGKPNQRVEIFEARTK